MNAKGAARLLGPVMGDRDGSPDSGDLSDDSPSSLSNKAAAGGRWAVMDTIFLQVSTTSATLVLARILLPSDFGAVAAAMVVVRMFDLLTQMGLGSSLVRRNKLDPRETSTIFWMAFGIGLLVGGLVTIFAGPLTRLIGQPEAAPLVRAMAVTIPLSQARNIGLSLLYRELRFRETSLIGMVVAVLYLAVAVVLAFAGFGPWSIIIGYLIRAAVGALLVLIVSGWQPSLIFDRQFVSRDLKFSAGSLGQRSLNYLYKNIDYWVISARLGATVLGVYYIAFVIPDLVRQRLSAMGQRVLYPVLSRIHQDKTRSRSAYLRLVRTIVFIAVPALAGISVLSETVVSLAFGDRWLAAAAPLAVLALASAVTSTSALCGVLASAAGRPHITIPAQAIGVVVLGFGLAVTVPSGDLTMISWAVLAAAVTTSIGLYLATGPLIALTLGRLVTELIPVIVPTFVMYASLWLIRDAVTVRLATLPAAIVLVAMGVLIYVALSWVFFRPAFTEQLRSVRLILNPKLSASELGTGS